MNFKKCIEDINKAIVEELYGEMTLGDKLELIRLLREEGLL